MEVRGLFHCTKVCLIVLLRYVVEARPVRHNLIDKVCQETQTRISRADLYLPVKLS